MATFLYLTRVFLSLSRSFTSPGLRSAGVYLPVFVPESKSDASFSPPHSAPDENCLFSLKSLIQANMLRLQCTWHGLASTSPSFLPFFFFLGRMSLDNAASEQFPPQCVQQRATEEFCRAARRFKMCHGAGAQPRRLERLQQEGGITVRWRGESSRSSKSSKRSERKHK